MAEQLTLAVRKRTETGKGPGRRTRERGEVPGIYYNAKGENIPVVAKEMELRKLFEKTGHNHMFQLDIQGEGKGEAKPSLVWDLQHHPAKDRLVHVDFYGVDMAKELRLEIPVVITGEPSVVKNGDGVLHVHREYIEVTCLPSDIPDSIVLDVAGLGMNESISLEEIQLPKGVRTLYEENFAVVGVSPMVEQTLESPEDEEAAEGAEGEEAEGQEAGE